MMIDRQWLETECFDPEVGARVMEYPDVKSLRAAEDQELLLAHLELCPHCNLMLNLQERIGQGIRDGSLEAAPARRAGRSARIPRHAVPSLLALAATVALVVLLPLGALNESGITNCLLPTGEMIGGLRSGTSGFDAHFGHGIAAYANSDYESAAGHFQHAAEVEPGSSMALLYLGNTPALAGRLRGGPEDAHVHRSSHLTLTLE
jgi:hypothetical protein